MDMAKRKYSKMKKIEPSVQTMTFSTTTVPQGGGTDSFYIDLSQAASLANRRFYRQGINWAVSGIKLLSTDFIGSVYVTKLPNTWVMSNAWEKAFRAWQRMNRQSLSESESLKPKFLDFKIHADSQHQQDGFSRNLLPITQSAVGTTAGEWIPSVISIPSSNPATGSAVEFELIAVGDNTQAAKSLIEGYAASRGLPNIADPNTPDDALSYDENWLTGMFNDGTEQDVQNLEHLTQDNDIAPYPFENAGANFDTMYPGGANQMSGLEIHSIEFLTGTTIGGTTRIKGGNFPCGLVKFDLTNTGTVTSGIVIQLDLVPGNHRGYLCEPMTEM
jgi:hypothetical protein